MKREVPLPAVPQCCDTRVSNCACPAPRPRSPADSFHLQLTGVLSPDTCLSGQQVTGGQNSTSKACLWQVVKKTAQRKDCVHTVANMLGLICKEFVWRWSLWVAVTVNGSPLKKKKKKDIQLLCYVSAQCEAHYPKLARTLFCNNSLGLPGFLAN